MPKAYVPNRAHRYRNRQVELVKLEVWVPADRADDLFSVVRSWRKEHGRAVAWARRVSAAERNA